jgi:hypothetical protein
MCKARSLAVALETRGHTSSRLAHGTLAGLASKTRSSWCIPFDPIKSVKGLIDRRESLVNGVDEGV